MDGEIKAHLNSLEEKVDRLVNAVLGNGHEGLMIRVDRMEQKEKRRGDLTLRLDRLERRAAFRSKFFWTIGGGAVLAVLTALAAILFK